MIDIHSHIIPSVDDGSQSFKKSLEMLKEEIENGVTAVIATPHYCPDRGYKLSVPELKKAYKKFLADLKEYNLPIKVLLGEEIFVSEYDNIIKKLKAGELLTLCESEYVLLELPGDKMPENLFELIYSFKVNGYKVIIAHIERYSWMTPDVAGSLADEGSLLQVNAESFFDIKRKSLCKKLLKNGLVDVIASDIHSFRKCCLLKLYNRINNKDLFLKVGEAIINRQ